MNEGGAIEPDEIYESQPGFLWGKRVLISMPNYMNQSESIPCGLHGRVLCLACMPPVFAEKMSPEDNKKACESLIEGHYKRTGQKLIASQGLYEKLEELGISTEYIEIDKPLPAL